MEQIKQFIKKQKLAIGILLFAVVTVVSFVYAMPDGYTEIYGNLSENDQQEMLTELQRLSVDYKLDETGTIISVPDERAAWVRSKMTEIGLPKNGSKGFEIFDESSLGATQSDKDIKLLRALKGQLENDIVRSFSGIEGATVHLTMAPEGSIFEEEKPKGSASVTLQVSPGASITPQQLSGIQNMIGSAVQGVEAEDVVVTDSKLGVLSDDKMNNSMYMSSSFEKQLQITSQTESNIHDDIMSSLSSLFGIDNVKLNVKVSINFDEVVKEIEAYEDEGTLRSREEETENTVTAEGDGVNEAGIESNGDVIEYAQQEDNVDVRSQQEKARIIENFEVGKTVEQIKKHPELTNTNVVAWVNDENLDQQKQNALRESVGVAAGLTPDGQGGFTNGQVSIMPYQFVEKEEVVVEEPEQSSVEQFISKYSLWIMIGGGLLVLLILVLVILLARKGKKRKDGGSPVQQTALNQVPQQEQTNQSPAPTEEEINQQLSELSLGTDVNLDSLTTNEKQELIKKRKMIEEKLQALGGEKPRETAEYIRKLLNERG